MYKYQVVFLGNTACKECSDIKSLFLKRTSELGLQTDMFEIIYSDDFKSKYFLKNPSFAFYFGQKDSRNKDIEILETLLKENIDIFPLYFGNEFFDEIPEILNKKNGKKYDSNDLEKYVNFAFESFRLLRKSRKLFISYRRTDSSNIANQLFDALVRANYDVFLDTYSINPGVDFQQELHNRLTDCDVIIQLYSKGFKESRWCNEEIKSANQKKIGIVKLLWPDCNPDVHDALTDVILMQEGNFVRDENNKITSLSPDFLSNVVNEVESVRARNLKARQINLANYFFSIAKKTGHQVFSQNHYILENFKNGKFRMFIPAVGIPQSYDCYNSLRFRDLLKDPNLSIFLIYDDLSISKEWIKHLDWLNSSLEVKTIKKKEFTSWLKQN